ncbi:MAG: cytochrome c3 family protein [Desulfurivibrionaceae bacterium]
MHYTEKKISGIFTARKMSVAMAGLLLGTVCLLPRAGTAQVAGQCVNCHTMHNSQNGVPMNSSATVYRALTRGDCVGCHTGTSATDLTTNNIPKVNHTTAPTAGTLAGGSFYWVGTGAVNADGHNVLGIASPDPTLGNNPPGGTALVSQLTCAGTTGCHGDRTKADQFTAVSGAHHAPKQNPNGYVDGTSVGASYRFLNGIKGIESADWELPANLTASNHNEYYGVARTSDATVDTHTISSLCGQCHGAFHTAATNSPATGVGISYAGTMTSPWVRHPTDFDMNTVKTKEYSAYGGGVLGTGAGAAYVPAVPVASSVTTVMSSTGAPASTVFAVAGDAIVTCVSCHRAHGSNQPDMLRWDYTTMNAGGGLNTTGCFACHTTKDDGV